MNPIIEQIKRHRSIRRYRDETIPEALLHTLIESAQCASSSSFVQAYSLIRVTDPEHRETIAEAAGGQPWVIAAAEFLVVCADLRRIDSCCQDSGLEPLQGHTEHFITAAIDAALMAQNLMLAAESVGLGGVFIGGIRNAPQVISELLEIPTQVAPLFGIALGWPEQSPEQKPRMPVSAVLHQGRYTSEEVAEGIDNYDKLMGDYYANRSTNQRDTQWSQQTAQAIQGKRREHMLDFLQGQGLLKR